MNRRGFIVGSVGLIAAPAIVRAASLMPVRSSRFLTATEVRRRAALSEAEFWEAQRRMARAVAAHVEAMARAIEDSLFAAGTEWPPQGLARLLTITPNP